MIRFNKMHDGQMILKNTNLHYLIICIIMINIFMILYKIQIIIKIKNKMI